jgi:hypothetical protein
LSRDAHANDRIRDDQRSSQARQFYGEQLGFRLVSEDDFKGAKAEPRQHTILGWAART